MRRPTRTRRLSIAAIASLLVFAIFAVAGIRSFWTADGWFDSSGRLIALNAGCLTYWHFSVPNFLPTGHLSSSSSPDKRAFEQALWGFRVDKNSSSDPSGNVSYFRVASPIWPLLILLLIAPVRWLIARPANAPAFPVIANANQA